MKNRDELEEGTNNPGKDGMLDLAGNEQPGAGNATNERSEKSQGWLGRIRKEMQLSGTRPGRTGDNAGRNTAAAPATNGSEMVVEVEGTDDHVSDVVKWMRRVLIPLAILAWTGVVILILWGAGHVTRAILLLIIAALLAYALVPAVTFLERVMPRFLAILIVYIVVLAAISVLLYFVVRTAITQVTSLSRYLGGFLSPGSSSSNSPLQQTLRTFGISSSQIEALRSQLIARSEQFAGNAVPVLTGVVNTVLDIVLVAVMSIYLLIDGSRLTNWLRRHAPRRQRSKVNFLLNTMQRVVGGYIRGQLFLCFIVGVLVGAGMQILGVPYALLLGVLAFVLEFIPILGTLVSGAICVLLALTKGWLLAVIVLGYFIIVHVLEGDVLGPRIVGKAIGLHPVVALFALVAGSELFGIWGALLASPTAGLIQALLIAIWSEWSQTHPEEFDEAKNKVVGQIDKNVADKPVGPKDSEARLL
jgi:predicted PurR-regulated permease PerM